MTTIFIKTYDQILSATVLPRVASGNQNTVRIHVDFDSAWDGYEKSAVFRSSKNPTLYEKVLSTDGNCLVPPEVLVEEGHIFISIKGVNGAEIKTSEEIRYKISAGTPSIVISDPTDDVYHQLLGSYGDTNEALAVERARINNLVNNGTGDLTNDAELQDIRVGEDGTIYETAGEAIREQFSQKARSTEINRFLHNDVFANLDIAHEIGDVICDYRGGTWTNYMSESFTLPEGTYTLIIPKLDISNIGNICLEYVGGVTDAKLRIISATKTGAYQFYQPVENVNNPIIFRVRISNATEPEYRKYGAYSLVIIKGDTTRNTIIPDYLTNYSQMSKNKVNAVYGKNLFDKNSANILYGYYLNGNNTVLENDKICVTDFLPVEPNTAYVASGYKVQASYIHFYGEEKNYIGCLQGYDITDNCIITPENCYFVKWSVGIDAVDVFQFEKGTTATEYEPYTDYQPRAILEKKVSALEEKMDTFAIAKSNSFKATCETLAKSGVLSLVNRADVKKNKTYIFTARVGDTVNIRFAHGEAEYGASYLDITNTTVNAYNVTNTASKTFETAHGLNISGFITVIIRVDIKARLTIFTANGYYRSDEFDWSGCNGNVRVVNNGSTLEGCSCSLTIGDISTPIWIFGDSYLGLQNEARHPYYLLNMGVKNWLPCGFPGGGAAQELESLKNLLKLGKPKYIVWCLGMNNGDSDTINNAWLTATEEVIRLCEENSIEIILATIPSCGVFGEANPVVVVNNSHKNEWIRASGYRYVDYEKAVIKDADTGWYDGMLSGDGIHPTELGAQALASRLLTDVPEIVE